MVGSDRDALGFSEICFGLVLKKELGFGMTKLSSIGDQVLNKDHRVFRFDS